MELNIITNVLDTINAVADVIEDYLNSCDECENCGGCEHCDGCEGCESYGIPTVANAIKSIVFNENTTIVFWTDGTKTVVKCSKGDKFSKETGVAMAILKRMFGNNYYRQIAKVIKNCSVDKTEETVKKRKSAKSKNTKKDR